jgi:ubiquinone/menaquinone biosynthesis C-methylase UbiE
MSGDFRAELYARYVSAFKGDSPDVDAAWYDHKLLPLLRGVPRDAPLLELGCGPGHLLEYLKRRGFSHAEGVDIAEEQVARARARGVVGIVPRHADACALPQPDASVDGAFLVTVLGEVADQEAALRELSRVVKRGGRIVVGELFGDPHWVSPAALRRRARAAGLRIEHRVGGPLGYFARLVADEPTARNPG